MSSGCISQDNIGLVFLPLSSNLTQFYSNIERIVALSLRYLYQKIFRKLQRWFTVDLVDLKY